MDQILAQEIPVASSCGGDGICGKCIMEITSETPLSPPSKVEQKTLEKLDTSPKSRLSCQIHPTQDLRIETTYW